MRFRITAVVCLALFSVGCQDEAGITASRSTGPAGPVKVVHDTFDRTSNLWALTLKDKDGNSETYTYSDSAHARAAALVATESDAQSIVGWDRSLHELTAVIKADIPAGTDLSTVSITSSVSLSNGHPTTAVELAYKDQNGSKQVAVLSDELPAKLSRLTAALEHAPSSKATLALGSGGTIVLTLKLK